MWSTKVKKAKATSLHVKQLNIRSHFLDFDYSFVVCNAWARTSTGKNRWVKCNLVSHKTAFKFNFTAPYATAKGKKKERTKFRRYFKSGSRKRSKEGQRNTLKETKEEENIRFECFLDDYLAMSNQLKYIIKLLVKNTTSINVLIITQHAGCNYRNLYKIIHKNFPTGMRLEVFQPSENNSPSITGIIRFMAFIKTPTGMLLKVSFAFA